MKKSLLPFGIYIFGFILLISSAMNIWTLLMKGGWYINEVYAHWPKWAAVLRYSFSWLQRILGIIAGVGILLRIDICRKLALILACFTIATVYWKHPYVAYQQHVHRVIDPLPIARRFPEGFVEQLVMPSMIINCLLDIGFCLLLIAYFTKPEIISYFKKKYND